MKRDQCGFSRIIVLILVFGLAVGTLVVLLITKPMQKESKLPIGVDLTKQGSTSCYGATCSGKFIDLVATGSTVANKTSNSNSPESNTAENVKPSSSTKSVETSTPAPPVKSAGVKYNKKVFLLIYDPKIESRAGQKLSQVLGWNDSESLTNQVISAFESVSGGRVQYSIAQKTIADKFVTYTDGFSYEDEEFINTWNGGKNFNHGDAGKGTPMLDYPKMLSDFGVCDKLNSGEIDELWVWAFPYAGMWESNMVGPGAYWLNSNPTQGTSCNKLLPIMGWNYERGVAEALHSYGHRVESTMVHIYGSWQRNDANSWNKFTTRNKDISGKAWCGDVHFPPNGLSDYDYSNSSSVMSACDDFLAYPSLTGNFKSITCSAWGCSHEGYMRWWLTHLPKSLGQTEGKDNDWWKYVVNLN